MWVKKQTIRTDSNVQLPVQTSDQVSDVVGQDDPVLAHVPVVPQNTHRDVGGHLGQLSHDVAEGPGSDKEERTFKGCRQRAFSSNIWRNEGKQTFPSVLESDNWISCSAIDRFKQHHKGDERTKVF